jgi:hypothetical protein
MKHLTLTGYDAGLPVCGAPPSDKSEGSMHAMFWWPDRHGRDFCPACMAAVEEVSSDYELPAAL